MRPGTGIYAWVGSLVETRPQLVFPSLAALQAHLVPCLGLAAPLHLLQDPTCGTSHLGWALCLAPSVPGRWGQPHPQPQPLVTVCGVIGLPLASALAWCPLFTCYTIPLRSCSSQGPSGPAVPELLPVASTMWPMPPWWSAHVRVNSQTPERRIHILAFYYIE